MFSIFKREPTSRSVVGVYAMRDRISLAQVEVAVDGARPRLISCHNEVADEQSIKRHFRKTRLGDSRCHLVLDFQQYELLTAEAPAVPPEELADAMRWRARDLISRPIEDSVVDAFLVPEGQRQGRTPAAFVVAASRHTIDEQVKLAKTAGANVESIDISEMALRNLVWQSRSDTDGLAVVMLAEEDGLLAIFRDGQLHLSRRIPVSSNQVRQAQEDDFAQPVELLAAELRRSFDYYESHYGLPPVSSVGLWPQFRGSERATHELESRLGVSARSFVLNDFVDDGDTYDAHHHPGILMAVGAALRPAFDA